MRFDLIKQDVSGSPSQEKSSNDNNRSRCAVAQGCEKLSIDKGGIKSTNNYMPDRQEENVLEAALLSP